jgi:hypothetical protein
MDYKVKGYVKIVFCASKLTIKLKPDKQYLSPDQELKCAVGFNKENEKSFLFKLNESGELDLDVLKEDNWLTYLIQVSILQKPVIVTITGEENSKKVYKLTGFTFPAVL